MSNRDVIGLDTALAERTLATVDPTGAVVPPNFNSSKLTIIIIIIINIYMPSTKVPEHAVIVG